MNSVKKLSGVLLATTMLVPGVAAAQDEGESGSGTDDVIVIRGQFIPEPQRETAQVASFLTTEDLARAGDANAAVALTRLSGLSIVSGRFAYVRGLGERYSLALLNGSPIPSPEPLRRTVPLDLFPSDLLGGISVQKTYSANFPGDFGGGVIELSTLREATENYAAASVSVGYNSVTTLEEGIFVNGSDTDWLGYDDGLRDIPGPLAEVLASDMSLNDFDDETIELVGESLVNSPLSVIQNGELSPNYSAKVEVGRSIDTGAMNIGLVGVVGYDQSWTTTLETHQLQENGILGGDTEARETTMNVDVNALGSASFLWGDQALQSTLFYVHSTSKEAQVETGFDFNTQGPTGLIYDESSGWYERELAMLQLSGDHLLGPLDVSWRGAIAESSRDAPYERQLRRNINEDGVPAYLVPNAYDIRFSELTDTIVSGGVDVSYEFDLGDGRDGTISVGADQSKTERDYDLWAFQFAGGNSLPDDVEIARPDFLFSPDNIDPARFELQERVSATDSYDAELEVTSAYVQADLNVIPYVRTTFGVRYEDSQETVDVFNRFGDVGADPVDLRNEYWLPSALVTWNFAEDLQLRLGYSETIARPQFRELARSGYFDPENDRAYRGNSELIDTEITNYDARLEYYMGRDAFVTLAAFYKELENPIEEINFSPSTFEFETTFVNSPSATVSGGEFEFRRYFQSPFDNVWLNERDWLFSVNYTYTQSEVEVSPNDTIIHPLNGLTVPAGNFLVDGLQLQGTPENILNLQTGWESNNDELTVLVGWVDERILQRGIQGALSRPDIIEDPGVQLDLTYRRYFDFRNMEWTLGISGRNLLDEDHIEYQASEELGQTDFNSYERGRSFSVSLSSRF